jgi:hypothetical protein
MNVDIVMYLIIPSQSKWSISTEKGGAVLNCNVNQEGYRKHYDP